MNKTILLLAVVTALLTPANGATLAQIAEKSGQPVATIVDVLNSVPPLARTEALAELRAASAKVTA